MTAATVTASPVEPREVWLRGNSRVAATLAAVASLGGALVVAAACTAASDGAGAVGWWLVVGGGGIASSCLLLLAWASSRPRLVRQGERLLVRVSPMAEAAVPLAVVECVFSGSNPLAPDGAAAGDGPPAFRVGTVILRLAERAVDHRDRDTFPGWVTWRDGAIVIDGRWCEPLAPSRARELGVRLAEAKRVAGQPSGVEQGGS